MMKKYLLPILVPALLLCMLTGANAQVAAQSFSVSPYAGGASFLSGQSLDTSGIYGVRAGYNFTNHFGIEGVTDYSSTNGSSSNGYDVHIWTWHLDMLYHFMPEKELTPYVAAGYGWQNRKLPGDNSTTRNGLNYGLGLKWFFLPAAALRGDFRHLVMKHSNDKTYNDIQYTIGVDFLFGGNQ